MIGRNMAKLRLGYEALADALEASRARVKELQKENSSLRFNLKSMKATNKKYRVVIKAIGMEMSDE